MAVTPVDTASALYERHYRRVHGYCLYRLRNADEADDAAQTTFLYAVRALKRGVVPNSETSWLLAIAHNACLACFRQRGRRRNVEVLSDPQTLDDAVAHITEPDDLLELDQALAVLPDQQRRAFVLREFRGLSYREVADELGVSTASVEMLIFRARRTLAHALQPETPPARGLMRHGFDFGSLVAALKSAFGGASTAKVAAGAAAVVTATTLAVTSPPAGLDAPLPGPEVGATGRASQANSAPVTQRPLPLREAAPRRRAAVEEGGTSRPEKPTASVTAPGVRVDEIEVPAVPDVPVAGKVSAGVVPAAGSAAGASVSLP